MNIKVFNLMSRINKTRHISCNETCTLDVIICNNKQLWKSDKYRCESKELIDKGRCDDGVIWNPSICECEYDKSYDIGEYLDYKNCKCRKKLIDKLAEECGEDINGDNMIHNRPLNDYGNLCKSCTIYIVLLIIIFIIIIGISSAFFYFDWLKKKNII